MKLKIYRIFALVMLTMAAIASCTKDYEDIKTLDERNISEYISRNGLKVQPYDTTGLYYEVLKPGSGENLDYTQQIPLIYTVRSLDGSYISQDTIVNHYSNYFGYYSPASIRDLMMKVLQKQGGSIRVILPSRKAYGRTGNKTLGIPGNASLDFTISVLEKNKLPLYEEQMIKKYLGSDLQNYTKSPDGIYYKIGNPGTGSVINQDSTLTVNYTGRLLNGVTFESNEGASVSLSRFITAWQQAVPLVKVGGSIRFIFPSTLAYGLNGSTDQTSGKVVIPAFSPLDFDVTVTAQK